MNEATDIDKIQVEMAYTTWDDSCKNPIITEANDLRECRRSKRHTPPCASGFGTYFITWD